MYDIFPHRISNSYNLERRISGKHEGNDNRHKIQGKVSKRNESLRGNAKARESKRAEYNEG